MNKIFLNLDQKEKVLKKCALIALLPIEAPEINSVPEFFSYKKRTVEILKKTN